ncbi:MAG: hypothetical protein N4A43_02140 [Alphaproteobacteria bacterium]|jgi:hypothetical protein|nr:hypothetical protein [Alphaproteobacteria bacterium]
MNKKIDCNSRCFLLLKLEENYLGEGVDFLKGKKIKSLNEYYKTQRIKNKDYFDNNKPVIDKVIDEFDMSKGKFFSLESEVNNLYKEAGLSMHKFMHLLADSGFDFNENEDVSLRFINKTKSSSELTAVVDRFKEWKVDFSDNIKMEIVNQAGFLAKEAMKEKIDRIEGGRPPLSFSDSLHKPNMFIDTNSFSS